MSEYITGHGGFTTAEAPTRQEFDELKSEFHQLKDVVTELLEIITQLSYDGKIRPVEHLIHKLRKGGSNE